MTNDVTTTEDSDEVQIGSLRGVKNEDGSISITISLDATTIDDLAHVHKKLGEVLEFCRKLPHNAYDFECFSDGGWSHLEINIRGESVRQSM